MGIKNKDHALYMATGIDNSGLIEDADLGKKIVKNMTDAVVQEGSRMQQALSDTGKATQGLSNVRKESESLFANFKPTTESAKRMRDYLTSLGNVKVTSLTEQIKEAKVAISQTESDIKKLQATFDNAAPGKAKMFALSELNAAKKALGEIKGELTVMESHMSKTSTTAQRLTSQIRLVKDEMGKMAMAGKRNTEEYENLRQKAIQLQQQLNSTNKQMKILASPMANFQGVISGITGMTGALSAGMGALGLFSQENENMARIQTKLQSVMAITIGLQQVATTLNKNSAFQLVSMAKVKNTLTAATTRLSIALGISNVAAKTLMATLTFGLSLAITGLVVLWDHYSSKAKQAAEKQKLAQQQISNAINSVTGTMADQMVTLHNLIKRWDSLGDNLKRKKKFIDENKDAFHSLGITVNTVNEAENALVRNTGSVIKAMQLRAQAAAYQKIAQEEYEKMARAELQAQFIEKSAPTNEDYKKTRETTSAGTSTGIYKTTQTYYDKSDTANAEANKQKRVDKLRVEARMHLVWGNHVMKSTDELNAELSKGLDKAGINEYTGSDTYKKDKDAAKKAQEEAEKLRKQTDKYKVLLSNQAVEEKQAAEDLQLQVDEARMKAMDEGSKKTIEEMELNFEKEMQAIDRQKEGALRKKIDDARSAFEANPKNKGKSFDASGISLSDEENSYFDDLYKTGISNHDKIYNEYVNRYQSYTDERIAIEKKFNDDIFILQEARKKAQEQGDVDEVGKIDRSIAKATTEKGKSLMGLDYEKLKETPEYVRAFENLKETSSETLKSLLEQLENAKTTAAQVLSPDQLREYTTTIQDIMNELDARNPFQALSDKKQELAQAEQELAEAQIELENARQQAEAVKGGAKIEKGVSSSNYNAKSGKIDSTKAYTSEAQALENVREKVDKYNKAKDNVVSKDAKVKQAEKSVKEQIDGLSSTISDLGNTIGGPAGEIISLIGDIGSFTLTAMSGVKAAADTSAQAISTVEKASVILAVISAALQIGMKIASMFGADYSNYNKAKENYESYAKVLDVVIGKQKELIETLTGKAAVEASEKALELIEKQADAARALGKERLNAGASGGSHSIGVRQRKDMNSNDWAAAQRALGSAFNSNIRDGRMTGLFDLSVEQLSKLQSEAPTFWAKLDGDVREYLEQIIACNEEAKEMKETLNENLTGISFDSLFDNFLDSLYDMKSTAEDISDDMSDYMRKSLIKAFVVDGYKDKMKEWYTMWAASLEDGSISSAEQKSLDDLKNSIITGATESAKLINDQFSYLEDDDESGVTGKLQAALTEGTANEVLGVMNMGALDLRMLKEMTADHFKDYATEMKYISNMLDETRQINANTRRTADNTDGLIDGISNINEGLKSMDKKLTEISKNTKDTSGR